MTSLCSASTHGTDVLLRTDASLPHFIFSLSLCEWKLEVCFYGLKHNMAKIKNLEQKSQIDIDFYCGGGALPDMTVNLFRLLQKPEKASWMRGEAP